MLPFIVQFEPGLPVYEQVVYAVKKAVVSGQIRPGDAFPSVRLLSQELRINPNTAHKVVGQLVDEGLLEVHPGIGTIVSRSPAANGEQKRKVLDREVEHLVVEARKCALTLSDVIESLRRQWHRMDEGKPPPGPRKVQQDRPRPQPPAPALEKPPIETDRLQDEGWNIESHD